MNSPATTKFEKIEFDRDKPSRKLMFGKPLGAPGSDKQTRVQKFIGAVQALQKCPTYNLETIESVTINYPGALTPAATAASFGPTISPLSSNVDNPPAGASEVFSSMADPGKFQLYTLICAVQWRFDIDPMVF